MVNAENTVEVTDTILRESTRFCRTSVVVARDSELCCRGLNNPTDQAMSPETWPIYTCIHAADRDTVLGWEVDVWLSVLPL